MLRLSKVTGRAMAAVSVGQGSLMTPGTGASRFSMRTRSRLTGTAVPTTATAGTGLIGTSSSRVSMRAMGHATFSWAWSGAVSRCRSRRRAPPRDQANPENGRPDRGGHLRWRWRRRGGIPPSSARWDCASGSFSTSAPGRGRPDRSGETLAEARGEGIAFADRSRRFGASRVQERGHVVFRDGL